MIDIMVIILLVIIVGGAILILIKRKKSGQSCADCNGCLMKENCKQSRGSQKD